MSALLWPCHKRDVSSNLYQLSSYHQGAPQQQHPPPPPPLPLWQICSVDYSLVCGCSVWQPGVNIRELTETFVGQIKSFSQSKNIYNIISVSLFSSAGKH